MDKVVCFGKNYQDHMHELGDKPVDKPVIFLKPPSVVKQCEKWGETIQACLIPNQETHYECELVIQLNQGGYCIAPHEASAMIEKYTIGLDMTLRQQQALLKQNGHPWTIAKVFPDSCIIGPWIEYDAKCFSDLPFSFSLNNELKQSSFGKNMLFKPEELVSYASQFFPLCKGDILFTGTPSGVGKVHENAIGTLKITEHQYNVQWSVIK